MVRDETGLNVAVCAGILTDDQARRLAEGGVHRYNHNLETARVVLPRESSPPTTWDERNDTCRLVREHGMELCCGVLLGMGEIVDAAHRAHRRSSARSSRPRCRSTSSTPARARRSATARWSSRSRPSAGSPCSAWACPSVILRYAGGREVTLRELQAMGMTSGINALIVGNYLTTLGRSPDEDLQMLDDLQMPIGALSKVI